MAAAVIIALAIFVPTVAHGPSSSAGASHTAAGVRASRAGLSIRGLPTNAVAVPAKGRPAASTSTAPSAKAPAPTIPRAILAPAAGAGTPTRLGPDKSGVGAPGVRRLCAGGQQPQPCDRAAGRRQLGHRARRGPERGQRGLFRPRACRSG